MVNPAFFILRSFPGSVPRPGCVRRPPLHVDAPYIRLTFKLEPFVRISPCLGGSQPQIKRAGQRRSSANSGRSRRAPGTFSTRMGYAWDLHNPAVPTLHGRPVPDRRCRLPSRLVRTNEQDRSKRLTAPRHYPGFQALVGLPRSMRSPVTPGSPFGDGQPPLCAAGSGSIGSAGLRLSSIACAGHGKASRGSDRGQTCRPSPGRPAACIGCGRRP